MSRRLLWVVCALSAAAVLAAEPCRGAEEPSAEERIEKALADKSTAEFIETPLADVVSYFKEIHKINILVDRKALDDVGIGTDTPVTFNLSGVSLRSVLNLILRDLELTWTVRHEVLLITTPAEAKRMLSIKVYPVEDVIGVYSTAGIIDTETHDSLIDYDSLLELITTTVEPTTWDEVGGQGSIKEFSLPQRMPALIVCQTYHVHHQLAALLDKLRDLAPRKTPAESSRTVSDWQDRQDRQNQREWHAWRMWREWRDRQDRRDWREWRDRRDRRAPGVSPGFGEDYPATSSE